MDRIKYSLIAVGVAIIIGVIFGHYMTDKYNRYDQRKQEELHKKELEKANELSQTLILMYHYKLDSINSVLALRSDSIASLNKLIKTDGTAVKDRTNKLLKLSNDEKVRWLHDRYDSVSTP